MTDQEWQRVLDVNLTGAFYFCRAAAKHMIARRYGKIVNVSSTASIRPSPYSGPYAVSKSGLNMLTRSLAAEWAPAGITVNAISPGWFKTEMTANRFDHPELAARLTAGIPAGRAGDLRELGLAAVFLASAASDYITGQVLHVDGGLLLS
jgi:gluconate 5-dehydrogenase